MFRAFVAVISVVPVFLASVTVAVSSRTAGAHDACIEELDAHIQARFLNADKRFGVARIITPGDQHRAIWRFTPENDGERRTVAGLERDGMHVVVYLAGRRLLTAPAVRPLPTPAAPADVNPLWVMRRLLTGPVTVSPSASHTLSPSGPGPQAPAAEDLFDEGRQAFALFERHGAAYTFSRDGWSFLARPVRAGTETCLRCHRYQEGGSTLAIGDVLGVVFYGERPLTER